MMTGTYQLYLSKTMLALFSDEAFALPSGKLDIDGSDLRAHLTNTCLQVRFLPFLRLGLRLIHFELGVESGHN